MMKKIFKVVFAALLGWLFAGGIDLDDIAFRRNVRKLKGEKWFKELSGNGLYYERIYHNPELQAYVNQKGRVERILADSRERERFVSMIVQN
ncbi:hypothetical protein LCM10_10725 [Rossellomorea aquimaris]|uniref:hypothetical protein n=1 Tax=Rossellomorea aquimaris TaxID=189382 RepID=UPI001CD3903C|nr:hypothetical protein [Rossellomorea aquimaris]MCA1055459.1 hypothetical protein [Rossellomorea aquimaris]